jgi:hypothetical protein
MRNDFLAPLPLRKGATIVIGGPYYWTLAKRLSHFIQRKRPRLKVQIFTSGLERDTNALALIVPSFNPNHNRSLSRDIEGLVDAFAPDRCRYTNAVSGKRSIITLPAMPAHVSELLSELGYQQ